MKSASSFLLGLALLGGLAAQAQTTPAPKTQLVKPAPRPKATAAKNRPVYAHSLFKDTAAFRRSGRPTDGLIRMRARPKK